MFAFLRGTLHRKGPDTAIVDVGGVGYLVRIPLSSFYELGEPGEVVELRITTQVREDSISLYGFLTPGEQRLFEHLVAVSGVGARMALAVLSGMSVSEACSALAEKDSARLQSIPGIGKKTAERLVVELKDRAQALLEGVEPGAGARPDEPAGVRSDLISALVNLGYPEAVASRAVDAEKNTAEKDTEEDMPFEEILRRVLRRLHRK